MSNMAHNQPKPSVQPTKRPERPERPGRPSEPRPKAKPRRGLGLVAFAFATVFAFGAGSDHTFGSDQVNHLVSAGTHDDGQCVHFEHFTDHDSFHRHFFA